MFTLTLQGSLLDGIQFLDRLIAFVEYLKSPRAKELLAQILTDTHQMAFERGGWGWRGGEDWHPTDRFWVQHLEGKTGNQPMNWTGNAARTVHAAATAAGADVLGPSYLQKFLPGNTHEFRESFSVTGDGEGWVKMSEMDSGERTMRKRINVHERELAKIFDKDAEDLLRHAMDESGFGEFLNG